MIRLVSVPLPHLHGIAVTACLRGGPRYEGPRENGLTHLLEHMIFRGTKRHRGARSLMAAFEDAGEEPYAHTGDDELLVSVQAKPGRVDLAAELLAEVLLEPVFRDLERERRIVLEERLELVDEDGNPVDVNDLARRLVFGDRPLGRSVMGEESDILRYRKSHLERLRERLVRDGNLVVALAGPVGKAEERAVRRAFRSVPPGEAPEDRLELPPAREPRTKFVRSHGSAQCDVRLTFLGPGDADARAPALVLLANMLDGGPTARLPQRLVDEGYVYSGHAELARFRDLSLLEIDLSVSRERLAETIGRTLSIVASLRRGIEKAELERARERIRRRVELVRDDACAEAEWHARRTLFGLDASRPRELARLDAVTARELVELARRMLVPERLSAVVVGAPGETERRLATRTIKAARGLG